MTVFTPRMIAIAQMLPKCDTVADIGCDHGKLACVLIERNVCSRVIAVDISPYSVEKTRTLAKEAGIADRVDVRLGDGFAVVKTDEAQAAVLAGLGGDLITRLIGPAREIPLVLQPMQQGDLLRRFLRQNGYCVTQERMIEENGRIQELLRVERGKYFLPDDLPEPLWDEVGALLWERRDPLLARRLRKKAGAVRSRMARAQRAGGEGGELGAKKLAEQVRLLEWAAGRIERASGAPEERGDGECI